MGTTDELVLGIDLGTTFSTAAVVIDQKLHFAVDSRGEVCIPSVVHFPKSGQPIVGFEADKLRASDPTNTVYGVKRVIGRSAESSQGRVLDANASFTLKGGPVAEARIVTRAGEASATEIASLILRHLRERAEQRFGRKITKAVLTVPVTSPRAVREAMLRCGKMAGLEVVRMVHEPVAGAVARGFASRPPSGKPLLVYDFGGGTLDTTVVMMDGPNLRALASGGDDCLGGDDFDHAFSTWVANSLFNGMRLDVTKDLILWDRIQRQAERVKRALSSTAESRFLVEDALPGPSGMRPIDLRVRRDAMGVVWAELIGRSVRVAAQNVAAAGFHGRDLSGVLLIGGTSYMPNVRETVAQTFKTEMFAEAEPQTAVARGAAVLAAIPSLLSDKSDAMQAA